MNKKYFWRLQTIVMAAMLSVGFTSCCCDRNVVPPSETDGLEGYWLEDQYKTKTETINEGTPEETTQETAVFDDSKATNLFYLDGKGGGTYFYTVCTEERRNSSEEYKNNFPEKVGTFTDFMENTHTYFGYKKEPIIYFQYQNSTTYVIVSNSNNNSNSTIDPNTTIGDILGNTTTSTTIGELFGNTTTANLGGVILVNVIDGNIDGYHRATKVE